MHNKGKQLYRAASVVATVLLLIFSYRYIDGLLDDDPFNNVDLQWSYIALSVGLFIAFYVLVSLNWIEAARITQGDVDQRQFAVFMASQPFKYMPSSVFIFSSRAVFAKRLGISLKNSSIAQLLENAALIGANLALFVVLTAWRAQVALGLAAAATVVAAAGIAAVYGPEQFRLRISRLSIDVVLPTAALLRMFALCTAGWFLAGLAFVALHEGLSLDGYSTTSLLAANTIAFSASMLAVFAPGGIGVREFVYTQYDIGALPVLVWRIVVFAIDMVVGLVAVTVIYLWRPSQSRST